MIYVLENINCKEIRTVSLSEKIKIIGKNILDKYFSFFSPTKKLLEIADILLPNAEAEKRKIIEIFGIDENKFHIVPNGVDKKFANGKPEIFRKNME